MKSVVGRNRAEEASGERRVDALEELQEEKADGVALRQQSIAARVGKLDDQGFGTKLGQVIAQRSEGVGPRGRVEGLKDMGVDFGG